MKKNITKIDLCLKEFFYVLNASILVFVVMESFKPKIILAYFNLNYLLIIWVFLAIVIVFKNKS